MVCFSCGQPGHISNDCADGNPYLGQCMTCGNWGHTAKYCRHPGRLQDLEEEKESGAEERDQEERGANACGQEDWT